jgi:hypothetical protein
VKNLGRIGELFLPSHCIGPKYLIVYNKNWSSESEDLITISSWQLRDLPELQDCHGSAKPCCQKHWPSCDCPNEDLVYVLTKKQKKLEVSFHVNIWHICLEWKEKWIILFLLNWFKENNRALKFDFSLPFPCDFFNKRLKWLTSLHL